MSIIDRNQRSRKAYAELKFGPNWDYISIVRAFVTNFLSIALDDSQRSDIIAMAISELIENAVKYSDMEGIEINVFVEDDEDIVNFAVSNHTTEEHAANLKSILERIYSMPPMDAYVALMSDIKKTPDKIGGIGLARVRYESNAEIKSEMKNGMVTVISRFKPILNMEQL